MKKFIAFLCVTVISIAAFTITIGQQQIQQQASPQYQQQQQFRSKGGAFYPAPGTTPVLNVTINPIQNGWAQIGNSCAGCSSFFYQVTRTQQMYQGEDGVWYFYFYFYFYSNSYYPNGSPAPTYLTGLSFSADGQILVNTPYTLLEIGNQKFVAWIRTRNPNSQVRFNVSQMNVY